jgi:hypothetical protein
LHGSHNITNSKLPYNERIKPRSKALDNRPAPRAAAKFKAKAGQPRHPCAPAIPARPPPLSAPGARRLTNCGSRVRLDLAAPAPTPAPGGWRASPLPSHPGARTDARTWSSEQSWDPERCSETVARRLWEGGWCDRSSPSPPSSVPVTPNPGGGRRPWRELGGRAELISLPGGF